MANLPEPTSLPFEVKAIASFAARSPNEMSIEAGKIYKVIQTDGKGQWWNTQGPNGNYGWFPANYVEVLPPPTPVIPVTTPPPMIPQSNTAQNYAASSSAGSNMNSAQMSGAGSNPSTAAAGSNPAAASSVITYEKINANPPAPARSFKDKDNSPICVSIQIIGARNLKAESNIKCEIYLFHILNDKGKDGRIVHKSTTIKKTKTPDWNERFEVCVKDPELENIRIVVVGNKKRLGEVVLNLRATTRPNFTSPNFDYRYYKLSNGEGDINIWHQYNDSRQASGPSNFQHKAHIGFNSQSGTIDFGELASLPDEFRKLAMESQTPGHPPPDAHSPHSPPIQSPTPSHNPTPSYKPTPVHTSGAASPPPPPPPLVRAVDLLVLLPLQ